MLLQNNIFYTWYIDVCINKTTLPQRGGSLKMCKKCFPLSKSLSVSVQRSSVENCKWAVIRPGSFSLLADAFDPIQALPVWGHSVTSLWVGTAAPLSPSATRFIVSWKFWLYKKKKKLSCVTARGAETMCQLNNDVHGEYMQGLISACIFTLRKSFTSIFHDVSDG